MRIRSVLTHSVQAVAEGSLIALLVVGLMAGTTLAAKPLAAGGGKTAGGTISGPLMVIDANGNGLPNYMDDITFTVSTTASDLPMVGLRCYQGTSFVLDGYIALYDASWLAKYFTLGSSYWAPALDATCTARLFYYDNRGREKVLATTDFGVAP
jgi:hypothetical protein